MERSEGRVQEANARLAELQAQNLSLQQTVNALFGGLARLYLQDLAQAARHAVDEGLKEQSSRAA